MIDLDRLLPLGLFVLLVVVVLVVKNGDIFCSVTDRRCIQHSWVRFENRIVWTCQRKQIGGDPGNNGVAFAKRNNEKKFPMSGDRDFEG